MWSWLFIIWLDSFWLDALRDNDSSEYQRELNRRFWAKVQRLNHWPRLLHNEHIKPIKFKRHLSYTWRLVQIWERKSVRLWIARSVSRTSRILARFHASTHSVSGVFNVSTRTRTLVMMFPVLCAGKCSKFRKVDLTVYRSIFSCRIWLRQKI